MRNVLSLIARLATQVRAAASFLVERLSPRGWEAYAALFSLAILLAVGGVAVVLGIRLDANQQSLREMQEALALIDAEGTISIRLAPTAAAPNASGRVFLAQDTKSAAVILGGLRSSPHTLLVNVDGERKPVRNFTPDDRGRAFLYLRGAFESSESWSVEKKGGTPVVLLSR